MNIEQSFVTNRFYLWDSFQNSIYLTTTKVKIPSKVFINQNSREYKVELRFDKI